MTRPFGATTIRQQLTLWYAAALTVMLVVYATTTYLAVRHEFIEQLDAQLHEDFEDAETRLTRSADGSVAWTGTRHHDEEAEARLFEIWSASGEQLLRSGASASLPPVAPGAVTASY